MIVLAPNSIQESIDLMYESFDLAEKYRNPVEILSEAAIGQMMEAVEFPEFKEREVELDWTYDGTDRPHGKIPNEKKPAATLAKYTKIADELQRWESYRTEDAEYVFVAFGLPSRTSRNAVDQLREAGEKVGLIRPITVWPFPFKAFAELGPQVKGLISVESTDAGQLIEDVALAAKKARLDLPVYGLFSGLNIPKTKVIYQFYEEVKAGQQKEVF
jgi:2-oxoglutarate ferredoxin oxidoreductase subunit alpha